jgi:hypothetical protein
MTAWDRQNRDFLLPTCNTFQKYDAAQIDRRGHDQLSGFNKNRDFRGADRVAGSLAGRRPLHFSI